MGSQITITQTQSVGWQPLEKWAFRVTSLFFLLQILPLDLRFFQALANTQFHFKSVLDLSTFLSVIVPADALPGWGAESFLNWALYLILALWGAVGWHFYEKLGKKVDYDGLQYGFRVVLRYRLAAGLLAFGFYKVFQLQMPYPSLSNLHTNYGDMLPWKVYFQTHAIAPNYQSFLGWVEIAAAVLLVNRRTTVFGAGLVLGFLGNITAANIFYDIGHQVYAGFLVLIGVALLAYDVPRLYRLIIQEKPTSGIQFQPEFSSPIWRNGRIALRSGFVAYAVLLAFLAWYNAKNDPFKVPQHAGLSGAYGYYIVDEFRLNGRDIPFSDTDPNRWQDVVFEKWATASFKINRSVALDISDGDRIESADIDRDYELAGLAGRHYFDYQIDSVAHTLALRNKNPQQRSEQYLLHYTLLPDSDIVLEGVNEKQDSVFARLNKIERPYMLFEGRRKQVKINSIRSE